MDTQVIVGATLAGAVGYFGAKLGAGFDDTSSIGAGLGLAIVAGGVLSMTSKKQVVVTDEQAEWEKELAEGAQGETVESAPAPAVPGAQAGPQDPNAPPAQQQKQVGHPLNGEAVKFTPEGCIDFQQHCTLMVFCHKLAATQSAAAGKQLVEHRRAAAKEGNEEQYKQLALQKKGMEQQFQQQMIQQIFMKLGVQQQQFEITMQTYMRSPEKGPIIQNLLAQCNEVPQTVPGEEHKEEPLSRERLLEIVQIQMDLQVKSLVKMMSEPPPSNPQEQGIKMIINAAKDEDNMFEKTGIELANFNYQVIKSELNKDPEFLKVIEAAQSKLQEAQKVAQAAHAAAQAKKKEEEGVKAESVPSVDTPASETKTEEPKTEEPKTEEPKTEEPKTEEPKTEEPKTVEPQE